MTPHVYLVKHGSEEAAKLSFNDCFRESKTENSIHLLREDKGGDICLYVILHCVSGLINAIRKEKKIDGLVKVPLIPILYYIEIMYTRTENSASPIQ